MIISFLNFTDIHPIDGKPTKTHFTYHANLSCVLPMGFLMRVKVADTVHVQVSESDTMMFKPPDAGEIHEYVVTGYEANLVRVSPEGEVPPRHEFRVSYDLMVVPDREE